MNSPHSVGSSTWVIADRLPRTLWWRLITVLVGTAIIVIGAQVATPSAGDVPGTLQPFAIMLVGATLGPWVGAASALVYVLLGALGAPVFANGTSGFGGATSGYFIGFVLAALVVGLISQHSSSLIPARALPRLLAGMLGGLVAIYVAGLAWLTLQVGLPLGDALDVGFSPFIVADLLEAVLATAAVSIAAAALRPTR